MTDTPKDTLVYEEWLPDAIKAFHELHPWGNPKEWGQVVWNHLMAIIEEKDAYIAEMVAKAVSKHRPAYDEQSKRLMEAEDRIATLEAQLQEKGDERNT